MICARSLLLVGDMGPDVARNPSDSTSSIDGVFICIPVLALVVLLPLTIGFTIQHAENLSRFWHTYPKRIVLYLLGMISVGLLSFVLSVANNGSALNGNLTTLTLKLDFFASAILLPLTVFSALSTFFVERREKTQKDEAEQQLMEAVKSQKKAETRANAHLRTVEYAKKVNELFLAAVTAKATRVAGNRSRLVDPELQDSDYLQSFYRALKPEDQIEILVACAERLVDIYLSKERGANIQLRIAVFRPHGRKLVLDLGRGDVIKKHFPKGPNRKHVKSYFSLEEPRNERCLAVAAAYDGELHVIEDTHEADLDSRSPFKFLRDGQKERIGSMVAMPIGEPESAEFPYRRVVCFDSPRRHVFRRQDKPLLQFVMDNLDERLAYELMMQDSFRCRRISG